MTGRWQGIWSWQGIGLGALLALGLVLIVWGAPGRRRVDLGHRIGPYVRDVIPRSALLDPALEPGGRIAGLHRALAPLLHDLAAAAERRLGAGTAVRARLDRLGDRGTVQQFRVEQVVWAGVGALAGAAVGLSAVVVRSGSPVTALVVVLLGGLTGLLGRDWALSRAVRRREDRILTELPTVADLLALAVGAGEGLAAALDRVSRTCSGELAADLRRALAEVRTGLPLIDALDQLAARTGVGALARFLDGIVIALQRGTPVAEVIRAQAQDVRELSRRRLIESGARREVAMMLPVVFLVLPVTVLFVVYPGLAVLDLTR